MIGRKSLFVAALALAAAAAGCKKDSPKEDTKKGAEPAHGNHILIAVTEDGFEPDDIKVTKGEPVTFVFERKTDKTCAKEVIIHVDEGNEIETKLPLGEPVEVEVSFPKSGDVKYACGMDMVKGSIHVQ